MSTEGAPAHLDILRRAYRERFGRTAGGFLVSAPGRINLMGDHIDYAGLAVLPLAIQRRISLLASARDDARFSIASTDARFPPREFEIDAAVAPFESGDWGNYAKAAALALAERHSLRRGVDAVVHSDIPVAAGLSSSSALVVAVALALLRANEIEVERLALAELLADAERYVGTRGGGMDQAICLAAQAGAAARVEFEPLRVTPVPVPARWRFVVADSRVRAEKAGAARDTYNTRTLEVRRALDAVAASIHGTGDPTSAAAVDYRSLIARIDVEDLLGAARRALDPILFRRFRHVITEGKRVEAAEGALREGDIDAFGQLMRESHASLRDDFEVGHPDLDRLVDISLESGAVGARLTGAGLGGCVIALCEEVEVDRLMVALKDRFYEVGDRRGSIADSLFTVQAAAAASVREINTPR